MATRKKLWRRSLGERGCRVVVFERTPGGILYREAVVRGKRVTKKSLGHRDRSRAEAEAYRVLAKLKARQDALDGGSLTLSTLFDMYRASPQHKRKKERTRREDEGKLERLVRFLGPDRDVRSLSPSDVERYRQARMSGTYGPRGKVGVRAVEADLVSLLTMLNWATTERTAQGRFLLDVNPLRGIRLPKEKNPRRPVETYDRYLKLLDVAAEVDWRLPMVLRLAEATGQRISAILALRRTDVDTRKQEIFFRGSAQKTGYDHPMPIPVELADTLVAYLDQVAPDAEALLFPSDRYPDRPVSRWTMDDLLRKAYEKAELQPQPGGLWHPWRRKWATERKEMPLKDVARAGGWKDTRTLELYQQVDEETLRRVVCAAPKLTSRGLEKQEILPQKLPH
jgi:integrase